MTLLTHSVRPMKMIRPLAVAASLALVITACGSDDDSSADTTTATSETTVSAPDVTEAPAADTTEAAVTTEAETETTDAATPDGPLATLTVDDVVVEGSVVECSLENNEVSFTAQGETSEMIVTPLYGTYVGLDVTGDFEFVGSGDTVLDGTTVTITGSGALADPSLPTTNFVLEADLSAC